MKKLADKTDRMKRAVLVAMVYEGQARGGRKSSESGRPWYIRQTPNITYCGNRREKAAAHFRAVPSLHMLSFTRNKGQRKLHDDDHAGEKTTTGRPREQYAQLLVSSRSSRNCPMNRCTLPSHLPSLLGMILGYHGQPTHLKKRKLQLHVPFCVFTTTTKKLGMECMSSIDQICSFFFISRKKTWTCAETSQEFILSTTNNV